MGFINWCLVSNKFRTHQLSKSHIDSTISLSNYSNCVPIDGLIDNSNKIQLAQKLLIDGVGNLIKLTLEKKDVFQMHLMYL